MTRFTRPAILIGLVGVSSAVAWVPGRASTPQALPACQTVSTSGTLIGSHTIGPVCIPNSLAVECDTQTVGLSPSALVTSTVCVPFPASAARAAAGRI